MQQQPTSRTDGGASIAQKYGLQHSPLWPRVEKAVLQKFSKCATCSSTAKVSNCPKIRRSSSSTSVSSLKGSRKCLRFLASGAIVEEWQATRPLAPVRA